MIKETKIDIHFSLPHSAKKVFDFIIRPENMPLYQGYFLVPGIKNVVSSDSIRKVGTIDKITNTDNSSHESRTDILDPEKRYSLTLSNIKINGFKEKLANPLTGFKEDWIFHADGNHVQIDRTLVIFYNDGFINEFLVNWVIKPQMELSLHRHHRNLFKFLS